MREKGKSGNIQKMIKLCRDKIVERKLEKIEKIPRKKGKNGKGRIVSDKVGKMLKKVRKNTGGSYEVRCTKKERKTEGKTERNIK